MVEFPVRLQIPLKVIAAHQRRIDISRPCALYGEILGNGPPVSEDGIVIFPCHRHEEGHPPHRPAVLELDRVPFPLRRIYDRALGHASVRKPAIVVQHVSAQELPFQGIRHETAFRPSPHIGPGMDQEEIIFSADLIQVAALIAQVRIVLIAYNQAMEPALQRSA